MPVHEGVREDHLTRALISLSSLEYRNFHIYIGIDGFLSDRKLWVIKNCLIGQTYTLLNLPKTGKPGFIRNRLIELGDGDVIVINDSDDISMKDRLDLYNEFFLKEGAFLLSGSMRVVDSDYKVKGYRGHKLQKLSLPNRSLLICPFNNPAVAFRRKGLGTLRFDETADKSEDYSFWIDIIHRELPCVCIENILVDYMQSDEDLSKRIGLKYFVSDWKVKTKAIRKLGVIKNFHFVLIALILPFVRLIPSSLFNLIYRWLNVRSKLE